MRKTILLLVTMGAALLAVGGAALAASINCPNAPDGRCNGTNVGDALYGTDNIDRMYGYGGADLMYGYAGADRMFGGDESGLGDKMLGGTGNDYMNGNRGADAIYAGNGDDTVYGGRAGDLIQGDNGEDELYPGLGADQVNAKDGQRDLIVCEDPNDLVYHDPGLDVLRGCGEAGLIEQPPPEELFEDTGKVLVGHKDRELCLPEEAIKGHLKHGDEIVNPQGCSKAE
jgi:Ca2+-binding RTX toxin-like protein